MSTFGSVRLVSLLRCRPHSLLYADRVYARSSFLPQTFAQRYSAVRPLSRCDDVTSRQSFVEQGHFGTPKPLSKFSTSALSRNTDDSRPRGWSKTHPADSDASTQDTHGNDFDLTSDPNKSLFRKFNDNLKKYWYVMLPVHVVTSGAYFVGFCYLASIGVSPVPLLEQLGWFDEYLKNMKDSHFGVLAVALVFQKLASPLRYMTTWYSVKALVGRGKLLTSSEFFAVVAEKYRRWKRGTK